MRSTAATGLLFLVLPAAAASQIQTLRDPAIKTFTAFPTGAPPTYLQASPGTVSIYLRWGCPDGASGYDVYVTPAGGAQVKLTPTPIPGQCIQDLQKTLVVGTTSSPTYSLGFTHSGTTPGASYSYVVVALYPSGAQGTSPVVTAQANLVPGPSGVVATASGHSASVRWQAVSGATGYKVFRKLAGESAFQEIPPTLGSSATSSNDLTVLQPGQHQYYVQTLNGLPSQPATVSIPPWPAPSGFVVSALAFAPPAVPLAQVTLSWNWLNGPKGYLVFRQRPSESGYLQLTPQPLWANGYLDNGMLPGQRASYYVKALDGDPTPPVTVVVGGPSNIVSEVYRGTSNINFSWNGTGTGATVQVLRGGTPSGPFYAATLSGAGDGWAHTTGNGINVLLYYKVVATYLTGVAESAPIALTIPPPPKGVTYLSATPGGSSAQLVWVCDPEALYYTILRGKGKYPTMDWIKDPYSTSPLRVPNPGGQCSYTDTGLESTIYQYRVLATYADPHTSGPDGSVSVVIGR